MLTINLINKTISGQARAKDVKEKGLIRASMEDDQDETTSSS